MPGASENLLKVPSRGITKSLALRVHFDILNDHYFRNIEDYLSGSKNETISSIFCQLMTLVRPIITCILYDNYAEIILFIIFFKSILCILKSIKLFSKMKNIIFLCIRVPNKLDVLFPKIITLSLLISIISPSTLSYFDINAG